MYPIVKAKSIFTTKTIYFKDINYVLKYFQEYNYVEKILVDIGTCLKRDGLPVSTHIYKTFTVPKHNVVNCFPQLILYFFNYFFLDPRPVQNNHNII